MLRRRNPIPQINSLKWFQSFDIWFALISSKDFTFDIYIFPILYLFWLSFKSVLAKSLSYSGRTLTQSSKPIHLSFGARALRILGVNDTSIKSLYFIGTNAPAK